MEYNVRDGETAGVITTGLRQRFEVVDGSIEVPDDLDKDAHQRLIDAGHTPADPGKLPNGVDYGGGSDAASGSSDDSGSGSTDDTSGDDGDAEAANGDEETGAMTADALTMESEPAQPPNSLEEMNRSELYQYGNDELGLELSWSGEDAPDEEEMRDRISEEM